MQLKAILFCRTCFAASKIFVANKSQCCNVGGILKKRLNSSCDWNRKDRAVWTVELLFCQLFTVYSDAKKKFTNDDGKPRWQCHFSLFIVLHNRISWFSCKAISLETESNLTEWRRRNIFSSNLYFDVPFVSFNTDCYFYRV